MKASTATALPFTVDFRQAYTRIECHQSCGTAGGVAITSELAVESAPAVEGAAREAAEGQVIYITEGGKRLAGIVPADIAALIERMSAGELEEISTAAADAGLIEVADAFEDLADRAAVLEARSDPRSGVPWDQVKAEAGL